MIQILTDINLINKNAWKRLADNSFTATWFQTEEAYCFFDSLPEMFLPFSVAVYCDTSSTLKGICIGYITREQSCLKQYFTRRAIIIGGPMLADDITEEELSIMLNAIVRTISSKTIYIETRNFNSYDKWKSVFERYGFYYHPHLNFHVDTTTLAVAESNVHKSRKRDIKSSFRDGATIIESPTLAQVLSYYNILANLYESKVKTPLFPFSFFERLWHSDFGRFILVELNGEIIGGTVCVAYNNKCLYEWFVCGRDGEWKTIFPSSVATYAGICYAAEHGMPKFDMMGAGKPDEAYGVRDFKARFGGREVEYGRFLNVCHPLLYHVGKAGVKLLKSL